MSEWYRMKTGHKHDNSSDLSVETSCEMSDSFNNMFSDNLSPIPTVIVPRKLDFSNMDDNDCTPPSASPAPAPLSPPYKKVRALSPHTPKSLLQKCSTPSHHPPRSRLFPPKLNIPSGQALNKKKRALSKTPTSQGNISPQQPAKRLRFVELDVIGCGQFGRVARCVNKLDGCVYALKRSLRPVAGSAEERAALTEVYAHAALGVHPHVVRYYSAWAEDDHMIIQNEFCDGGSLQQLLESGPLPENELLLLLAHISDGLAYMHSLQLVHMDVKPGNIFICNEEVASNSESDDGYDDEDEVTTKPKHKYKIGLTLFEAGGGGPLPKNGQEWHDLRDGKLPDLPNISREFNQLLKVYKISNAQPNPEPRVGEVPHEVRETTPEAAGRLETSRDDQVCHLTHQNRQADRQAG
ncbi:unnamed protein product [Leptidea sinapis]|uniref:Protein kinase domain-containing protein n=1 Tax=Leptidea sinapis TaxID=189913 RepID=A0A5E4R214_9NEOP|nr:unnamed protein product [Leptidea sinapis]